MLICRLDEISEEQKKRLFNRAGLLKTDKVKGSVEKIVGDVKRDGDKAIREFTETYDDVSLSDFKVTEKEFEDARDRVSDKVYKALETAHANIKEFHERQLQKEWFYKKSGVKLGQDRKSTRLNSSHIPLSRMPSSA